MKVLKEVPLALQWTSAAFRSRQRPPAAAMRVLHANRAPLPTRTLPQLRDHPSRTPPHLRIPICCEAIPQECEGVAYHSTVFTLESFPKHCCHFDRCPRNVFKTIDEIMSVFTLLAVVVCDGFEAGEANDVRMPDRFGGNTILPEQLCSDLHCIVVKTIEGLRNVEHSVLIFALQLG